MTTFKDKAHSELLSTLNFDRCCTTAFLSALAKGAGTIEFSRRRMNLCIQLDTYEQGLKCVELFKQLYPAEFELSLDHIKSGARQGKEVCTLQVPSGFSKQAIIDFALMGAEGDMLSTFTEGLDKSLVKNTCCKKAYFKGLFLSCGSVYVPSSLQDDEKKDGYHFELQLDDAKLAEDVKDMLEVLGVSVKTSERGEHILLYVKDKDDVLNALITLDLTNCALMLRSIIDERETANSLNRAIICETANLDKVFAASSRHLLAIGKIKGADKFDALSATLQQTANARAEYPEASMQELADILAVSKSCLNHRLRKLCEIADTL